MKDKETTEANQGVTPSVKNINKVSYSKTAVTVKYGEKRTLLENNVVSNGHNSRLAYKPTEAFTNALNRLIPHLVMICEERGAYELDLSQHYILSAEAQKPGNEGKYDFGKYYLSGVSVREEGAVLIGGKRLEGGAVLDLKTPFIRYEVGPYKFREEFQIDVKDFIGEVEQYLQGKYIKHEQLGLFTEGDGDNEA